INVEDQAFAVDGLILVAKEVVLPRLELSNEAHALAVLGNVGEPGGPDPRGPVIAMKRDGIAANLHHPLLRRAHARDRLKELGLAVAGNTGDADDFAGTHGKTDALDPRHLEVVVDDEIADFEQGL